MIREQTQPQLRWLKLRGSTSPSALNCLSPLPSCRLTVLYCSMYQHDVPYNHPSPLLSWLSPYDDFVSCLHDAALDGMSAEHERHFGAHSILCADGPASVWLGCTCFYDSWPPTHRWPGRVRAFSFSFFFFAGKNNHSCSSKGLEFRGSLVVVVVAVLIKPRA